MLDITSAVIAKEVAPLCLDEGSNAYISSVTKAHGMGKDAKDGKDPKDTKDAKRMPD